MGHQDVADVLQRNLDNEQQTLKAALSLQEEVARVTPKDPAQGASVADRVKSAIS